MINYFEQLGFGQNQRDFNSGAMNLLAAKKQKDEQAALMQQQQQKAELQFANEQQKQRAAQGAGAFYNALNSGNTNAALQIAQQYQDDINTLGDPSFTVDSVAQMMQTPEGVEQLKQMSLGMVQISGGPEQFARFTAQQVQPVERKLSKGEEVMALQKQYQEIARTQGAEAAKQFAVGAGLEKAPAASVNVNMPQDKKISELDAKAFTQYNENAKSARKELNSIAALKPLSERAVSGTGANLLLTGGKLLNQLGFEVEGLTESEVFQQLANTLVLDKSQQMSGALSNADMTFLTNTAPTLTNTKEGRRLSLDMAERLAKRQVEIQNLAVKFRREAKQSGSDFDDAEFQQYVNQWAEENPLFDNLELPKNVAPQAAVDYLKSNPESKAAFQQKYGYLPEGFN
jgi:hypothetical protein